MNSNQDSFFQAPRVVKDAAYFRSKARAALSGRWPIAILVSFLASLLGGGIFGGTSFRYQNTVPSTNEELTAFEEAARRIYDLLKVGDFRGIFSAYPLLATAVTVALVTVAISTVWAILIAPAIRVGYEKFNLNLIDGNDHDLTVGSLFHYFRTSYLKCVGVSLLYNLLQIACRIPVWIAALLSLLLLLPALASPWIFLLLSSVILLAGWVATVLLSIYFTFSYRFAFLILAEYPEIGVVDAMRNSRILMKGHKWRLFCLKFSFIGWYLLAAFCTCGIGAIVVNPYLYAAETAFYSDLTHRDTAKETEFPSIDPEDYRDSL